MLRNDRNKGKRQAAEREQRQFEQQRQAKLRKQLKPGDAYRPGLMRTLNVKKETQND
jgi:hypothetical protein